MADVRIEMEPGWEEQLRAAERAFFETRLGPDITADAKANCPIDTGRLVASLDQQVVDDDQGLPELQVGSFPDDQGDVEYAAAVELGFQGPELVREQARVSSLGKPYTIREHMRQGNSPEQPYLRPALYRERY